ncbi:DsbA family protein [Schaalia suimastitidis]|uniref:DsbA family protein n=1 Tax=Schaalia suimastitidis TaxID=121163 RepID=UPI0004208332|nr:thioredoxin domain-containing protein [Schaalia suimastitidis]
MSTTPDTTATSPRDPHNGTLRDPQGTTASSRNPLMIVVSLLLLLIVALLAVIAVLLTVKPNDTTAATSATPPATTTEQNAQAPSTDTSTTQQDTYAPVVTDPALLELLHAEVRRDPADGQAKGSVDAPIVMVLYSDFSCPYCVLLAQEVTPQLQDLVDAGTLRIEWRDLAQISASSPLAAQAGVAAANQGYFWQFHDAVYANLSTQGHPEFTEASLVEYAKAAGVPDINAFTADMTSAETVAAVEASKAHAYQVGITGTPFMVVGDAVISGYRDANYVRQTILEQVK